MPPAAGSHTLSSIDRGRGDRGIRENGASTVSDPIAFALGSGRSLPLCGSCGHPETTHRTALPPRCGAVIQASRMPVAIRRLCRCTRYVPVRPPWRPAPVAAAGPEPVTHGMR